MKKIIYLIFFTCPLSAAVDNRHICEVKKSRLGHELLISVKDRVIARNQNKNLAKISEFTVLEKLQCISVILVSV